MILKIAREFCLLTLLKHALTDLSSTIISITAILIIEASSFKKALTISDWVWFFFLLLVVSKAEHLIHQRELGIQLLVYSLMPQKYIDNTFLLFISTVWEVWITHFLTISLWRTKRTNAICSMSSLVFQFLFLQNTIK